MSDRKPVKYLITEAILLLLPALAEPIDCIVSDWWMTGRHDGLRLTDTGDACFREAEIEYFEFPFSKLKVGSWFNFIVEINRKIKCPYYLHYTKGTQSVRIYDSKIAMMMTLYGDIRLYLDSLPERTSCFI